MSDIIPYRIQQINDNGQAVQITLVEDVQTEPVSQKQLIIENVAKKLDSETCLLYTSPSPRDYAASRMPSSA